MNVNYTAEELAFRDEVRAFLTNELPADIAAKVKLGKHMSKEDHERWQQILSALSSARRAPCRSASTWLRR